MLISCATPDDSGSPEDSVEGGVFPDSLEEKVDSLEEKVIATEQDATQSIQSLAAPSRFVHFDVLFLILLFFI